MAGLLFPLSVEPDPRLAAAPVSRSSHSHLSYRRIRDWQRRQTVWRRFFRPFFRPENDTAGAGDIDSIPGPARIQPEEMAERENEKQLVLAALKQLPVRQQQALMLREWQGLSVSETAVAMECSESSVKTHQARGLERLRQILESSGHSRIQAEKKKGVEP